MSKKKIPGILSLIGLSMLAFSSCDKDESKPAKPVVIITEVGSHDAPEGKVTAGTKLHLEAEIIAEGLIARIDVEIHQEEDGNFEIEESYTDGKYIDVKNADFHEHIDIPADAPEGEYHLHLTVTDKTGQTTTAESELIIETPPVNISIESLTFGAGHDFPDNRIGYIDTAPVIEAVSINAENGIERIFAELHSEGETTAFELDTTYSYNGETELTDFHKHVSIPGNTPPGDYHLHFRVYDKTGKSLEKSLDVEIKETGIAISDLEIGDENEASASNIHAEFKVTTTSPLKSIRTRIYKAESPSVYLYNNTFTDEFTSNDMKEYTFHKHLAAPDATAGDYIIEFRINDNRGAYKDIKDKLIIK
jgi:hypothetical protein